MEIIRSILYYTLISVIGVFCLAYMINVICGIIKATKMNVKEYGWNVTNWTFTYNEWEGISKNIKS